MNSYIKPRFSSILPLSKNKQTSFLLQSGYREGLTEGREADDALQKPFDSGYAASFVPFKRLGAIRGSLVVALLSADESENVYQELRQLEEKAKNMHCEMIASLKKESTAENIQTLENNFQLEDFAQTVQQAIENSK